jgi:hypothetical protein
VAERGRRQWLTERAFTALFFVLVAAVLLLSDKGQIGGDGEVRWRTLVALMEDGRVTSDRYTLEMPLAATPLWVSGSVAASVEGLTGPARLAVVEHFVQRFNKLVAFAVAAWLYRKLRRDRLLPQGAAGGVLGLLFLSLLIPNAKDFYSECLWTFLVCIALDLFVRESRTRAEGFGLAIATALAVPLNPVLAPVLLLTAVAVAIFATPMERHAAWRGGFLAAAGAGFGVCLALAENLARRGSALDFGYANAGFTTPLLRGLAGQLVSPARGAVFYLPAFFLGSLLLGARRLEGEMRRFVLVASLFGVFLILAYAKWQAWHGGLYWGPRFLLPLSVLGAVFLALAWRAFPSGAARAGLSAVAFVSFASYKAGVAIGLTPFMSCPGEECYWDWARLPLASWVSRPDFSEMLSHRSTAVELGAIALFAALTARDLRRRGRSQPEPARR